MSTQREILGDSFDVTCKKCDGKDIDLFLELYDECGDTFSAQCTFMCNTCGYSYSFSKFGQK